MNYKSFLFAFLLAIISSVLAQEQAPPTHGVSLVQPTKDNTFPLGAHMVISWSFERVRPKSETVSIKIVNANAELQPPLTAHFAFDYYIVRLVPVNESYNWEIPGDLLQGKDSGYYRIFIWLEQDIYQFAYSYQIKIYKPL